MTDEQLNNIEKLAKAATPGPYFNGSWDEVCTLKHMHNFGECKYTMQKCIGLKSHLSNDNDLCLEIITHDGILRERDGAYLAAVSPDIILKMIEYIRDLEADIIDCRNGNF